MTKEERQELAYILGLLEACISNVPGVPQDKLEKFIDEVSKFTLKDVDNPS